VVLLNVLQCKTPHSRKSHGSSLTNSLNLNVVKLGFDSLLCFLIQGDGHLMKAVENELNKSIKRHLESGESFLSDNFI